APSASRHFLSHVRSRPSSLAQQRRRAVSDDSRRQASWIFSSLWLSASHRSISVRCGWGTTASAKVREPPSTDMAGATNIALIGKRATRCKIVLTPPPFLALVPCSVAHAAARDEEPRRKPHRRQPPGLPDPEAQEPHDQGGDAERERAGAAAGGERRPPADPPDRPGHDGKAEGEAQHPQLELQLQDRVMRVKRQALGASRVVQRRQDIVELDLAARDLARGVHAPAEDRPLR